MGGGPLPRPKRTTVAVPVSDTRETRLFDLPIDPALLFSNHENTYEKKVEKRQTRLLRKLGFLKPFLHGDERIMFVTVAYSPSSFLEQLLTGWLYFCLRRCLLVFTNKRIWHLPTQLDCSPRQVIAQIRYPDCQTIFLKGKNLVVRYHQGTCEEFLVTTKKQKIESILSAVPWQGKPSNTPGRIHLCPRCRQEIALKGSACPHCKLGFKDEARARLVAALCPGGVFFYTRHPWLGFGAAVAELALLALVGASLAEMLQKNSRYLAILLVAAIAFLSEKAVSVYLAARLVRELIPAQRKLTAPGG